jgi:multiple sugar transport system ATP-binding protein
LRDDTRAELKQLHQNVGITTIYVTHDQVEAMTLADKIVVLDRGRIQQIGDPQAIYANPANRMVASFMGNPPMNLVYSAHEAGQFFVEGQPLPCSERLQAVVRSHPSPRYILGIRPEQIQVVAETEAYHLKSVVTVVEPLGRETLVKVELPGVTGATAPLLNLIAPAAFALCPGDRLFLCFDLEHLFLFDASTGDRLA